MLCYYILDPLFPPSFVQVSLGSQVDVYAKVVLTGTSVQIPVQNNMQFWELFTNSCQLMLHSKSICRAGTLYAVFCICLLCTDSWAAQKLQFMLSGAACKAGHPSIQMSIIAAPPKTALGESQCILWHFLVCKLCFLQITPRWELLFLLFPSKYE